MLLHDGLSEPQKCSGCGRHDEKFEMVYCLACVNMKNNVRSLYMTRCLIGSERILRDLQSRDREVEAGR